MKDNLPINLRLQLAAGEVIIERSQNLGKIPTHRWNEIMEKHKLGLGDQCLVGYLETVHDFRVIVSVDEDIWMYRGPDLKS